MRLGIEVFLTLPAVMFGDLFPGLIDIVQCRLGFGLTGSFVMGDSFGARGEESTRLSLAAHETGAIRLNRAAEIPSRVARSIKRRREIFFQKTRQLIP
jgi:hypothetical protein